MKHTFMPIALIVVGMAWLLDEAQLFPEVSWLWVFSLVAVGVALLLVDGINKSSVVTGPMLIGTGITTFMRQKYGLGLQIQLPLLMVLLGGLLLLARSPAIPEQREPGRPKDGEPPR